MSDIDWTAYTDNEVQEIVDEGNAEIARRNQLQYIPAQIISLNADYLNAEGVEPGEPWRQPTGAHDAYPKDWTVSHEDLNWVSLVDGNVWEPGVANWREDSGEEWPAWVQPTGSTDAYPAGAKVSHVEKHWTSDVDSNVWEPGIFGWTNFSGV